MLVAADDDLRRAAKTYHMRKRDFMTFQVNSLQTKLCLWYVDPI